jgi:uncharacterized protein YndB with AHSA1/START domain
MPLKEAERGCLVMADITGYTGLLAGSELEHAQDALRDLLQTVVGALRPSFRLAKLEGDAAFVYVLAERIDGSQLLDTLEAAYFAFRRRLEGISRATTCDCNACIRLPALDLKLIAHHGSFVRQRLYGVEELTGTDIIVVHRLLKNSVAERIGARGYLLLTDACLSAASLSPEEIGLVEHRETYGELGEVVTWIHDLEAAWQRERDQRRVMVIERDTLFSIEADLPVAPPVVWALVTDPAMRPRFVPGVVRVDETVRGGRRGVGTTNHCVHGEGASLEEILDWRPHQYFTVRNLMPGAASWVTMEEFIPIEDGRGTHVRIRIQRPRRAAERAALEPMREMMTGLYGASLAQVRDVLAAPARGEPAAIIA